MNIFNYLFVCQRECKGGEIESNSTERERPGSEVRVRECVTEEGNARETEGGW